MTRRRESLRLGSHWHIDCRLSAELPEDQLIRGQFLANILLGAVTVSLLFLFGWLCYSTWNIRHVTGEWDHRIAAGMPEVRNIQRMQREYVGEAKKIDQAYAAIRPPLIVSEFITVVGRNLPPEMTVEVLDWNDNAIVMRGVARASVPRAARILGEYVETLHNDPKIGPRFANIKLTAFDRAKGRDDLQNFGMTFHLLPLEAL